MIPDDSFDIRDIAAIPQRTHFIQLRPAVTRGRDREGLESYTLRLADLHSFSLQGLFRAAKEQRYIHPKVAPWKTEGFKLANLNGSSLDATRWASALNILTGQTELDCLTIDSLRGYVRDDESLVTNPRWCPECLLEDERTTGHPYGRLIWALEPAKACAKHGIRLHTQCHCGGNKQGPWRPRKRMAHVCLYCQRSLAECPARDLATAEELRSTELVAKLLDDPRFDEAVEPSETWLGAFLRRQVEQFHGNKLAEAARALQVDAASLSQWMSGHYRPTLGRVAAFADFYRCDIMDIFRGNSDAAQEPRAGVSPLVTYGRRAKLDRKGKENLRKEAAALLLEMPHIGAKGVADRLGVTSGTLRIAAPDIYRRLTAAWQASLDLAAQTAVHDFQRAAVQLMERGILPTLTGVWTALGRSPVDRPKWVRERCREIIATIRPQKDLFDQAAGLGAHAFTRQSPRYAVDDEGRIIGPGLSNLPTDWAKIGLPLPKPYRRSRRS